MIPDEEFWKMCDAINSPFDMSDAIESLEAFAHHAQGASQRLAESDTLEAVFRKSWNKVNPDKEHPCDD